jgi:acylphosphatase
LYWKSLEFNGAIFGGGLVGISSKVQAHMVVSGLVQGVYFRDNTRRVAERYDVTGWVRNLPGSRVEAMLEGERAAVDQVIEWAQHGPPGAQVDSVEVDWNEFTGQYYSFEVRY